MTKTLTVFAIAAVLALSILPARAGGVWVPNGSHINGLMGNGAKLNGGGTNAVSFGSGHVIQITAVELPATR